MGFGLVTFTSWEKIADVEVTADTTTVTLSNLDGDEDELYLIMAFIINPLSGVPNNERILLRYNNDSGSNYPRQWLSAVNLTVTAESDTLTGAYFAYMDAGQQGSSQAFLYAKSGYKRHLIVLHGRDTPCSEIMWANWTNTADNITSIAFVATKANGIGAGSRIVLFKVSK